MYKTEYKTVKLQFTIELSVIRYNNSSSLFMTHNVPYGHSRLELLLLSLVLDNKNNKIISSWK